MSSIEFRGRSDERQRDWERFLFQKGYQTEDDVGRIGSFIKEGMLSWGIRLSYIGANTTLAGGTEYAIELLDYRTKLGLTGNTPFDEYVWDERGLERIAEKNGIRVRDLDDVAGNDLQEYRHGGQRYFGDEKEHFILFVSEKEKDQHKEVKWKRGQRRRRWQYPEQWATESSAGFFL